MNFNESLEKLKESFKCVDKIAEESYELNAIYDMEISNILWRMKHDIQKLEWFLRKREEYLNNSKE